MTVIMKVTVYYCCVTLLLTLDTVYSQCVSNYTTFNCADYELGNGTNTTPKPCLILSADEAIQSAAARGTEQPGMDSNPRCATLEASVLTITSPGLREFSTF